MTALWRFMPSFICLVFCSNKKCLFDFNNMSRLIRTLPMVIPVSVLMGFDSTSNFKCILRYLNTTAVISQGFKMMQILCSDWLPERARWAYLCRSGPPSLVPGRNNFCFWRYNKPFTDHACTWLDQPRHFFRVLSWLIEKRSAATRLSKYGLCYPLKELLAGNNFVRCDLEGPVLRKNIQVVLDILLYSQTGRFQACYNIGKAKVAFSTFGYLASTCLSK